MSAENSQKLCIECRAMVPLDVENCPECGYPFDDDFIKRCMFCGSPMVADLESCPACDRPVETMAATPSMQQSTTPSESSASALSGVTTLFADQQTAASTVTPDNGPSATGASLLPDGSEQLAAPQVILQDLISAVQAGGRRSDETAQRLTDAVTALKTELHELKAAQEHKPADDSAAQITELKSAIAALAAQQQASEQQLLAAVNEGAARYTPVVLPASLKWLDYILIAVVLVMIFSIGNLLLMAYIAKLMMQA